MTDEVPWQLEWSPDGRANGKRNPEAWYRVGRLSSFGELEDREVECVLPEGSVYIGIFPDESKARAAAEYFELTGKLAPPEPPRPEPSIGRKILVYGTAVYLLWFLAAIIAWLVYELTS